jgi:TRAP-type mannitol/chloroaromatic compound transport system permease large subunit
MTNTQTTKMTASIKKQQQIKEIVGEIGELFGQLIGSLIATTIISGILYAILHFLIGASITYLQVFGALLVLDFIKNFLKK